jgi:hypothetical protein
VCVVNEIELSLPSAGASTTIRSVENLSRLTAQQQNEMSELLFDFKEVFSDKPGRTNLCEHHIELLPDAKPVFCRPYRLAPDKAKLLKEELDTLLEQGIIERAPSNGVTWASPIIMVPKAESNSQRLCTDMRQVNLRTAVDPFPLPRIDELLDRVGKVKCLTKVDMVRGYWQVPCLDSYFRFCYFVWAFQMAIHAFWLS